MFTGIVQGLGEVIEVQDSPGLKHFVVDVGGVGTQRAVSVRIGASVAINGVCLTVVSSEGSRLAFDAMEETLQKTNLGDFKQGDQVNVERSARMGDEIGGHIMSGHVIGMAEIVSVETPENNKVVTFKIEPRFMKYVLDKGFIGLDGCSLTVVDPDQEQGTFNVWLIPETLRVTTFGFKKVGDLVNLELDSRTQIIVDTVEGVLGSRDKV